MLQNNFQETKPGQVQYTTTTPYLNMDVHIFRVTGKCGGENFCYQNSSSSSGKGGVLSSRVSSRIDFIGSRVERHLFTGRAAAKI